MAAAASEILDIYIQANIELRIDVSYGGCSSSEAGRFIVTGPPDKLAILRRVGKGVVADGADIEGVASPMAPVTLPEAVKVAAGIPRMSSKFCFLSPLALFHGRSDRVNLVKEPWAIVHLLGGFAYFDERDNLLGVNALTIVPSFTVLHVIGPFVPADGAVGAMHDLGRLASVAVDSMVDHGFLQAGWVHPDEQPNGHELSVENIHGGFLFQTTEGHRFFPVTPFKPGESLNSDGKLGRAMIGLRMALIADNEGEEVKRLARRTRWNELIVTAKALLGIVVYLAMGCAVMCPAEGWSVTDGIYFCMVTMSTVGYGDLSPSSTSTRIYTVFLIFLGILVIFSRCALAINIITKRFVRWGRAKLNRAAASTAAQVALKSTKRLVRSASVSGMTERPRAATSMGRLAQTASAGRRRIVSVLGSKGTVRRLFRRLRRQSGAVGALNGAGSRQAPPNALSFYAKNMLPSVFLNLGFQLVRNHPSRRSRGTHQEHGGAHGRACSACILLSLSTRWQARAWPSQQTRASMRSRRCLRRSTVLWVR